MNKLRVALKMREHFERRIAFLLDLKVEELPKFRLGTLVHLMFALKGDSQELGEFDTTITAILQLLGRDVVWADPSEPDEEEKPEEKVVVN